MRSLARFLPIFTFVLAAAPARAGVDLWTSHGPRSSIAAVALDPAHPGRIYAAGNGIFKSDDGGESWTKLDPTNGSLAFVGCVTVDPSHPSRVYAGSGDWLIGGAAGQLLRSTDEGRHWSATDLRTSTTQSRGNPVISLAPDGRNGDLYVGTGSLRRHFETFASLGLLKSTDGGQTLQDTKVQTPQIAYTLLADAASGILFAGSDFSYENYYGPIPHGGSVYRTADRGQTWAKSQNLGASVTALGRFPGGGILYAGTQRGGFWESQDGGDHWHQRSRVLSPITAIALDPVPPRPIYIGTSGGGVHRSTDAGSTWESFSAGLSSRMVTSLAFDETNRVLHAATSEGVFDLEIGAEPPPVACAPAFDHLCFFGSRFRIDLTAIDPATKGVVAAQAVSQAKDFGYFSFPTLTHDARLPEVLIKMVDARSLQGGGFWVFYSGLTSLLYTLKVTDTATGRSREYLGEGLCGAADTSTFPAGPDDSLSAFPTRSVLASAGDALLLQSGRFRVTLATDSVPAFPGVGIPQDDRFGYFSLPGLTGDPDLPEVFIKILDATALPGGDFWLFYTSLTSEPYILTVVDTVTGAVKTYRQGTADPSLLCGDVDGALRAPAAKELTGQGSFTWLTAQASRALCTEITSQIGQSWPLFARLEIHGSAVELDLGEEPSAPWVYRGAIEGGVIHASGNPGLEFACPGDPGVTPETGSDLTGTLTGRSLSGQWIDTFGEGDAAVRFTYGFQVTFEN